MVSVIILTHNEEQNLPRCLDSLSGIDDLHVLDSGSIDQTVKIAEDYGVSVSFNEFKSFGQQRNYALANINIKYEWILFLDADEVATSAFKNALLHAVSTANDNIAGFYCCWKMMLEGRWLKHCDHFPKWQFRLLRKGKATFTDFGHGQKEGDINGDIAYIEEPYLHYSFSKGWDEWLSKHNRYSTLEARDRIQKKPPIKNILAKNSSTRNPALKSWLCNIPGWPLIRFFYDYIMSFGFLDGIPGFIYCVNMAYYEFLVNIKMREIKSKVH